MLNADTIVGHIQSAGFTHIVWIPDSFFGPWESALSTSNRLKLIRPCREGEAIGIAAGLMLGRQKPLVIVQCTGLFEAGDALRNVVHDLQLPLKIVVGVRSLQAHNLGKSKDNCATFTEPILRAWQVPYELLTHPSDENFGPAIEKLGIATSASVLLLGE